MRMLRRNYQYVLVFWVVMSISKQFQTFRRIEVPTNVGQYLFNDAT